jgi:hypothetical protein
LVAAILVPTKRMTRLVSDILSAPFGNVPPIVHTAAVDMEGPILAAEVIAFLLQQPAIMAASTSSSTCFAASSRDAVARSRLKAT